MVREQIERAAKTTAGILKLSQSDLGCIRLSMSALAIQREMVAKLDELHAIASLEDYTLSLGDDVQRKELRLYAAFKRLKNFATLVPQKGKLLLYLHLNPARVMRQLPSAKDVSQKGHWGTGDVEVPLTTMADLEAVKPFIAEAYEGRSPASRASDGV